jgi:ribosomal protein L11 methyltransferase
VSPLQRISVRVPVRDAEPLRASLLALSPGGLEEVDVGAEEIELAVYAEEANAGTLLARLPGATVARVTDGWEDAWRAFHRPVVAGGLWLGPPWEAPPDPARAVVIDPGRAFGTGSHPTTRLCVALLAGAPRRESLLDVGCGSGVLSIAAARLGFAPVLAVDVDPVAVETTRANAAVNGVAVDAAVLDALAEPLPVADTAVANVLLGPVEAILARLEAREAITAGYLAGERPAHAGWDHVESLELDGWAADRFRHRRDRARPATIPP